MTAKLKIIIKAIEIRMKKGEFFNDIVDSYPNLTHSEIEELKTYFGNN